MLKLVKKTILSYLFMHFLLIGNACGFVLCVHSDGGMQLEAASSRCCESDIAEHGEASFMEVDCCVDVSLEANQQVIASHKTSTQVDYRVDSVSVDLHCFLAPRIPTGFHSNVLTATSHSPPNFTLRSLRSVMLLI